MPILGLVTGMWLHPPLNTWDPAVWGLSLLCSLSDSVRPRGCSGTPRLTLLQRAFISLGLHKHPRDRAGLVCKALETSDWLIHLEAEKVKVPGLVGIREKGQLEEKLVLWKRFVEPGKE